MFENEQQLRKKLLLHAPARRQKGRPSGDPFGQEKQRIRELLADRRQTPPDSQEYFLLANQYSEILDDMVARGLDRPVEDELLDEDLLSDQYLDFEKRWHKEHPYTIDQFVEEKCAYICLADVREVGSNTARARVVSRYKGEPPDDIRIKYFTPWGRAGSYREGERAVVFLDDQMISLGHLGRMPVVERNGVTYAASYHEDPEFWPAGVQLVEETHGGERVLLIELGAVEAILGRHRQKSEAAQKHELARSYLNLFLEQFSRDSLDFLRKATHYFIEAKDLDETLAEAHSGLAACYTAAGIYNITRPEESFGSALGPAKRALELNDRLAEAYTSLAYAYMCYTWDWLAAEAEYRRALGIDPDHVTALQGLAHWLAAMGRFRESLEEIDRAREVAPESIMVNVVRGFILYYGRDYEESWKQFLKAIDLNPHFDAAYYGLALACEPLALSYMEKGNAEEATRMFEKAARAARKAVRLSHGNPVKLAAQAHVHALSGDEDRAQRELQQLIALSTEEYVSPFQIATIFAAMVTTCNALEKSNLAVEYYEQALKYLDLAYRTRDQWLVLLNVEPRFTILHEDERFKDLIRKLNFPPAARAGEGADAGQADHQGAGVGER